ncbi:ESCRT-III subunit protein snf7 [Nowakowskiella sp. JEL0078]|nr:ESCRT-III subunit protein snf7 [Nowakowskiella sp. JEL0078]
MPSNKLSKTSACNKRVKIGFRAMLRRSATEAAKPIVNIREKIEALDKRQKEIESCIAKELEIAKTNASKNRKTALLALKRKRLFENQASKISETRFTLENLVGTIDDARFNNHTINVLKMGADSLKKIHENMDVIAVDDTMYELQEQIDMSNNISEAVSRSMIGQEIDEFDLEEELELLGENEAPVDYQVPQSTNNSKLQNLKDQIPAIALPPRPLINKQNLHQYLQDEDEEAEFAKLRNEMAL